jgi:hypothetical protein
VAEHRLEKGRNIDLSIISILDKASNRMDRVIKEAAEIKQH